MRNSYVDQVIVKTEMQLKEVLVPPGVSQSVVSRTNIRPLAVLCSPSSDQPSLGNAAHCRFLLNNYVYMSFIKALGRPIVMEALKSWFHLVLNKLILYKPGLAIMYCFMS